MYTPPFPGFNIKKAYNTIARTVDSYHSYYTLAGLSSAQHYYYFSGKDFDHAAPGDSEAGQLGIQGLLSSPFCWSSSKFIRLPQSKTELKISSFDEADRVELIHPIFVLPWGVAEKTRAWYERRASF